MATICDHSHGNVDANLIRCKGQQDAPLKEQALTMAMDVTADTLDQPISAQSIVKSARSNLKIPQGFASEHILISGDGTDRGDTPTVVGKRSSLTNRARGLRTDFTFFNEGFLKVCEYRRKKRVRDYMLELRFLDPRPKIMRRFVTGPFWAALGFGAAAAVAWLLTELTALDSYSLPATIVLATGAIVALLLCLYQSGEQILFCTANGNVPVLVLLTNFGCFRRGRKLVPEISRAIGAAASSTTLEEEPYLRAEMQDHYRLRNEGIITPKACNAGTSRILSRFG